MENKKEESIDVNVKGFWGQLFCRHDYIDFGKQRVYNSIEDKAAGLPNIVYLRLICKKCAKLRKISL